MATVSPQTSEGDPGGGGEDPGPNLPLIIGVAVGALVVMVTIILLILWRTGKLSKRRRSSVLRRSRPRKAGNHGNDRLREERKKSIIIVGPTLKEGAELYIVRHFYAAEDDNQLTLESGRIIEVLEKMDNGWWRGVTGDSEGWFPASFVRKIDVSDPTGGNVSPDTEAPEMPTESFSPPSTWSRSPAKQAPAVATMEGAFVNGSFLTPDVVNAGKSTGSTKRREKKAKKEKSGKSVERSESERINSMGKQDIEGYLNEIFSVEDETTPDSEHHTPETKPHNKKSPKNKKLSLSEPNSLSKKKKNLANSKKLQEQAVYNNPTTAENNKKNAKMTKFASQRPGSTGSLDHASTNGVKGSPLINPVHYMISSSESLISSTSCLEDSDRLQGLDSANGSADEGPTPTRSEVKGMVDGVKSPREESDGARGAPDGSSLVEVLPDGHGKELTYSHKQSDVGRMEEEKAEEMITERNGVNLNQSIMSNLKDQLRNRVSQPSTTPASSERRQSFVVMYPFSPSDSTQLTLSRNDVVFALEAEENGWIKGEKRDSREIGWFPKSYVREGKSPPGHADLMSEESETVDSDGEFDQFDQSRTEYRALYPYTAQQDGDLSIAEGDIIVVMETLDSGWWRGCHGDQEGWFPGSYVETVPQTPSTGSPFRTSSPLSTSSPAKSVDKSKRQSLPTHLEDATTPESQVASAATNRSPQKKLTNDNSPSKRQSMPPFSNKPNLPTRFVTPKPVQVTPRSRHRKDADKVHTKPSRPPPPVPKTGPDPSRINSIPGGSSNVKLSQLKRIKLGAFQSTDKKRRESFPRPSEPPPPVPSTSSSNTSPAHSAQDSVFSEDSPRSAYLDSVDSTEAEDLLLAKLKKSSLPGVHRGSHSPRSSNGSIRPLEEVSEISSALTDDVEATAAEKLMGESANPGDSSLSFNAIMNIFEKIADKGDSSANSLDSGDEGGNDQCSKPSLPPKPAGNTSRQNSSQSLHDLETVSQVRESEDTAKVTSAGSRSDVSPKRKPALPPRPSNAPQRSVSTSALANLPSSGKLGSPEKQASTSDQRLHVSESANTAVLPKTSVSASVSTSVSKPKGVADAQMFEDKPSITFKPPRPSYLPMKSKWVADPKNLTLSSELTNGASSFAKQTKDNPLGIKLSSSESPSGRSNGDPRSMPESPGSCPDRDRSETVHLGRGLEVVGGLLKDTNEIKDSDSVRHMDAKALLVQNSTVNSEVTTRQNPAVLRQSRFSSYSENPLPHNDTRQSYLATQPHRNPATSPLSIKTNPMRFFSPRGYSRSPSPSSTVSSTPLSPLTLSPLSTDSAVSPPAPTAQRGSPGNQVTTSPSWKKLGSSENLSESLRLSPSSAKDVGNPLRFYTPSGFVPRRGSVGEAGETTKWLPSETPITNSLPSLFYEGLGATSGVNDVSDRRNVDQRHRNTPRWHEMTSGVHVPHTPSSTHQGHNTADHHTHTNGRTHTTEGRPTSRHPATVPSSGDPRSFQEGRELNKASMSHQLKLVALKSEDLESDV